MTRIAKPPDFTAAEVKYAQGQLSSMLSNAALDMLKATAILKKDRKLQDALSKLLGKDWLNEYEVNR